MSAPKRYFTNKLAVNEAAVTSLNLLKCSIIEKYETIIQKQAPDTRDAEGGLYVGIAGVGFMCYHLSRSPMFLDSKEALTAKAKEFLSASLEAVRQKKGSSKDDTAFLLGNAGLYAVCAAVFNGKFLGCIT
jgi:hypothetical protein